MVVECSKKADNTTRRLMHFGGNVQVVLMELFACEYMNVGVVRHTAPSSLRMCGVAKLM